MMYRVDYVWIFPNGEILEGSGRAAYWNPVNNTLWIDHSLDGSGPLVYLEQSPSLRVFWKAY
jgi:hypothetical protein